METKLFSRSEVAAISGVPEDAIVFWLRHGLLHFEDRGERKHRRFADREVKMAALLGEARSIGMNVSAMKAISTQIRFAFDQFDRLPDWIKTSRWLPEFISAVGADDGSAFSGLVEYGHLAEDEESRLSDAATSVGPLDYEALWIAANFERPSGSFAVYRDEELDWSVTTASVDQGGGLPARSVISFDLSKILDLPWPPDEGRPA